MYMFKLPNFSSVFKDIYNVKWFTIFKSTFSQCSPQWFGLVKSKSVTVRLFLKWLAVLKSKDPYGTSQIFLK